MPKLQLIAFNYSRLRLIRPHQNTDCVRIIQSAELTVLFNIVSQWSESNSSEAICPY